MRNAHLLCEDEQFLLCEDGQRINLETVLHTRFTGALTSIAPDPGLFEDPAVEIEAQDWIGYLRWNELGVIPIDDLQRADQQITTVLTNFPIQPEAVSLDTGIETFLLAFNTDDTKSAMGRFFQKMCRNELGRVYLEGDGTLRFENRDARPLTITSAFTLDGIMTEFVVSYEGRDIYNFIQTRIRLAEIDAAATTEIWDLHEQGTPAIGPGETFEMLCAFSDPATGGTISGIEVSVDVIEFGSAPDYVSNDLITYLTQDNTIGGNAILVKLTNTHPTKTGYINDLKIVGKGIYIYDDTILESKDQDSIDIRGERRLVVRLEQITDPNKAQNYAHYLRGRYSDPTIRAGVVGFLANQTEALILAAVQAEPSTRFTAIESVTGISRDFYVNRIKYTAGGQWLWVDLRAVAVPVHGTFIWDTSEWDNEETARWAL